MLPSIQHVSVLPDLRLRLAFGDGAIVIVGFGDTAARGGVFAPLADPDFFARVRVGEGGRYLEWPGGLDFCADALRRTGLPEAHAA